MELLPEKRAKFTIEDPQEASASSDTEKESNGGVTGEPSVELQKLNETNALEDGDNSQQTIPDGSEMASGDTECSTKEPSVMSENNSASDLTAKTKAKTPFRTSISYTQHIPTQPTDIIEYEWPEKSGDFYFVQEQVAQLLDVKSFKRKYPDLVRRNIEPDEREFLMKNKNIANILSIHLLNNMTALRFVEVMDLMSAEYPAIHLEYQKVITERRKQALLEKQKELDLIKSDAKKLEELRKKAIKSAMKFNKDMQTARKTERKFFLDPQTSIVQSAANRWLRLPASESRPSSYPVALIPGQFCSHYKKFPAKELYNMPFNTILENDQLFLSKRERSPSPIHIANKEAIKGEKLGEMDVDMKNETENHNEVVVEKPLRGRRPSAASNGGASAKRPRKNAMMANKSMFSEAIAAMSTPMKTEASTMPPSPATPTVAVSTRPSFASAIYHSPIPEEINDSTRDSNAVPDEDERLCIVCNLHETDIPMHALAVDLGRTQTQTPFVRCADCGHEMHAGCIDMSPSMVAAVRTYAWRCAECKECSVCGRQDQEDSMMCCDLCDRGYHTFCTGISVPPSGQFVCVQCRE